MEDLERITLVSPLGFVGTRIPCTYVDVLNRLSMYEDLLDDNKLGILPVPVGTPVWVIELHGDFDYSEYSIHCRKMTYSWLDHKFKFYTSEAEAAEALSKLSDK